MAFPQSRFEHPQRNAAPPADRPDLGDETILKMATLWGGEAGGLGRQCGSLEAGKSADFVVVPLANEGGSDRMGCGWKAMVNRAGYAFKGTVYISIVINSVTHNLVNVRDQQRECIAYILKGYVESARRLPACVCCRRNRRSTPPALRRVADAIQRVANTIDRQFSGFVIAKKYVVDVERMGQRFGTIRSGLCFN